MTIKQARVLLGKEVASISDEILINEIETAEYFKNVFFDRIHKLHQEKTNLPVQVVYKVP